MVQSLFDHYEFSLLSLLSENLQGQVHKVYPSISRITTMAELRQFECVTSSRGTPKILLDGFLYSKTTTRHTAQPDRQHNQTDSTARQTAQPDRQHSTGDASTRLARGSVQQSAMFSDHTHPTEMKLVPCSTKKIRRFFRITSVSRNVETKGKVFWK